MTGRVTTFYLFRRVGVRVREWEIKRWKLSQNSAETLQIIKRGKKRGKTGLPNLNPTNKTPPNLSNLKLLGLL
jgi:hypothetical protein